MNTNQKRQNFAKDLDKLMSDQYVLVPKHLNLDESFDHYIGDVCGIEPTDHENEYGFTTDGLRQLWAAAVAHTQAQSNKQF